MHRLFKAPLFHFLLLGTAVFVGIQLTRAPEQEVPRDEIVITAAQIERLGALFEKTRLRAPTPSERETLIENQIREEVFYREALVARLDRDDPIVRRRMKQKLEFLMEDIAGQVTPTEDDLRKYLQLNPDRFRTDSKFTFRHVYLNPDRRETVAEDARALLARLKEGADPAESGDSLMMIESAFENAPQRNVARVFGPEFADELVELPTGEWTGPVRSGYGLHIIRLDSRTPGRVPALDAIRATVAQEWSDERRRGMRDALYAKLRAKYMITVETE